MNDLFPLADKLRPESLEEFIGQEHLTGAGKVVRTFMETQRLNSLIFWGPPGTGKTTLSRLIVKAAHMTATEFSATISKLNDLREIMKKAAEVKQVSGKPLVLFVDEIHHFNKSSQDAFLPYVERGDIILLGTTTENPAFKINRALLSRLKILEFHPLTTDHLRQIFRRGLEVINNACETQLEIPDSVEGIVLDYSGGDARRLLNVLELLFNIFSPEGEDGAKGEGSGEARSGVITDAMVKEVLQTRIGGYDRTGDDRYQLISAFHKSVRNSDLDATLFWLYRMLEGGEDPLFILRRMIRICAEDIGFADPEALQVCLNARTSFDYLGQPEGDLFIAQAAVYLATAPKSNSIYLTEKRMRKVVEKYKDVPVPLHILNPSNFIAARKGAGKEYLYAHDFKEKTTPMQTLPEDVKEGNFFQPNHLGFEKKIKDRINYWQKIKASFGKK